MKFKSLFFLATMAAMIGYCGSSKEAVKEQPTKEEISGKVRSGGDALGAEAAAKVAADLNKQLAKVSLKNFPVGKAEISTEQYEKWAKASATVVSGAISNLPAGYVLQLTGHADPRGDDALNDNLSLERAQFVKSQLAKSGVTSPKLTVKGEGKRKLANPGNPTSGDNRRVEFVVVKQ